jgi:hypothetical protein
MSVSMMLAYRKMIRFQLRQTSANIVTGSDELLTRQRPQDMTELSSFQEIQQIIKMSFNIPLKNI